jgi:hypothetical protein
MARSNRSVIPIRSSSQSGLKKRAAPSSRISLGMCWLARLPDEDEVERDHKENEVEHSAASADEERARQEFADLSPANSKMHRPSTYQDDGPDQNRY